MCFNCFVRICPIYLNYERPCVDLHNMYIYITYVYSVLHPDDRTILYKHKEQIEKKLLFHAERQQTLFACGEILIGIQFGGGGGIAKSKKTPIGLKSKKKPNLFHMGLKMIYV